MSVVQSDQTAGRLEALSTEYQVCRRKLESKCEALLILSKELDQCRSERDQFKLMAEQLRDRYQIVKRQLTGDAPPSDSLYLTEIDSKTVSDIQNQGLTRLLFDTKEYNKSLKFEADDLRQKLHDAEGDIKLLREQIARSRVGTTDEGLNTRHFPAHEREDLVRQLEESREEFIQLERDLQQVIDEKEEQVTERDAYRTKYERLNTELNYILRGDDKRIVDIDALSMENKFLQERLKQMEEEKTMAIATVTKYKNILEKKKTKGILKLGQSRSGGLVITQKQVQQMVAGKSSIAPTPQALADLQGLCAALLDTINDKNLALSHQRKTNKLLGNRVSELEKKLKTLEVSGLWSVSGTANNSLEKLKAECQEIKTLVPRQFSQSTDASDTPRDLSDLDSDMSTSRTNSPSHVMGHSHVTSMGHSHVTRELSRLDLEELDLLPTKEEVVRGGGGGSVQQLVPGTPTTSTSTSTTSAAMDLADSSMLCAGSHVTLGVCGANELSIRHCLGHTDLDHTGFRETVCRPVDHDDDDDGDDDDDLVNENDEQLRGFLKDSWNGNENGDDDGDDDFYDDGDETNQHLKSLMDHVTSKLLERSHLQQATSVSGRPSKTGLKRGDLGCDRNVNDDNDNNDNGDDDDLQCDVVSTTCLSGNSHSSHHAFQEQTGNDGSDVTDALLSTCGGGKPVCGDGEGGEGGGAEVVDC